MKVLSAFLARDDLDSSERDALTDLMFQRTAVDFNQLNATLNAAGFCDVESRARLRPLQRHVRRRVSR